MALPLVVPTQRWACPKCGLADVTHEARPHTRFHPCRGMKGLTIPFLPAGSRADIRAVEREDYIGTEKVQTDGEGRPVMSVVIERPDGQDAVVYAPAATATITGGAHGSG